MNSDPAWKHLIPEEIWDDLSEIRNKLQEAGEEVYLVGGSLRDLLLGKVPHEYDLATSAHPEVVQKLFPRVVETGIQHGTVTLIFYAGKNGSKEARDSSGAQKQSQKFRAYEITTFRKDADYTDGRRPDSVEFGVSLSEDLKRRDFTVNAFAWDMHSESIIDEHDGLLDLEARRIRSIGRAVDRFTEDGLRPVRAIRFTSTLGFSIEPETLEAISKTRDITAKVAVERFSEELKKILLSERPNHGIRLLCSQKIFHLFSKLPISEEQESDAMRWFLPADLDLAMKLSLRFTYLMYHLMAGWNHPKYVFQLTQEWKLSREMQREITFFYDFFGHNSNPLSMELDEIRAKLLSRLKQEFGDRFDDAWKTFCQYLEARFHSSVPQNQAQPLSEWQAKVKSEILRNPPLTLKDLKINGKDIQRERPDLKGAQIGKTLQSALERCLRDPQFNDRTTLIDYILSI